MAPGFTPWTTPDRKQMITCLLQVQMGLTLVCRKLEMKICCRNKVGLLVLLLLFGDLGVDSQQIFFTSHMDGLQSLWAAWNTSTPDPRSSLLNWVTRAQGETPWPCYDSDKNWRGVTCLRYQRTDTEWDTWVVGLQLSDASIGGILPPGVSQIDKLVTLSLTGNPNLTGNLPRELADLPLNVLDLHDNGFNGTIPAELSKLGNLLELDLSGNRFVGEFPTQFSTTSTLQVFKIARNLLQGGIPDNAFEKLTQLLILDLSGNSFTGPSPKFPLVNSTLYNLNISDNKFTGVPELSQFFNGWLPQSLGVLDVSGLNIGGRLPVDWRSFRDLLSLERVYLNNINISGVLDLRNMQSSVLELTRDRVSPSRTLQVLSLMNNSITDVVFDKQFLKDGQIELFLQGNPYCAAESKDADGRRCFCEQYCVISPESSKESYLKVILITTSICAVLLGSVIFFLFSLLQRKKQHVYTLLKRLDESDVRAKRFEYGELRTATMNFAEERKLGQGAYGAVYKGILRNNVPVAVKQLYMKTQEASEDFLNEVLLITNLQHRNLVALKGYCLHGKEMLLVYEFVDYCDLDKLLLQGAWQVVPWPARMHICLGIAQGLYYLHASSSSRTKIIHRDIKASNVLVDKNLNPKISDFGLARPIQDEKSEIMTMHRAGTIGYCAPEYMLYGQLSDKADVYSFGVLLLEIVSGNRNKDPTQPDDEVYLPNRAVKRHKEDRLLELMDSRLHATGAEALEVQRVLEVAVMCVQEAPDKRPTMFRVVAMLAGDADVAIAPIDDFVVGSEYNLAHYKYTRENPFHSTTAAPASSSRNGSSSSGPYSNGNAAMELRRLHSAR